MTVSVPAQLVYSSSGDGVTSQFPYPVRVLEAGELVVALSENGVETTLVLNTDYTLSGIGDEAGVTVTLIEVPTASQTVIRYRATAAKQIVNLEDRAKNSAEAIEQQLDRMTMVDQDQDRRIGDLEDVADELDQAVDDAAASATAAATSAGNAAGSATAAAASAATIEIGTGSDLSIDPAKLLKRGDAADAIDARAPGFTADTMLVDNADGTARESKTFDEVLTALGASTFTKGLFEAADGPTWAALAHVHIMKRSGIRNVYDYGASATAGFDNTAAFHAAIAALAGGSGIIDIPITDTGKYEFSGTPIDLDGDSSILFRGVGSTNHISPNQIPALIQKDTSASLVKLDGTEGITFDGLNFQYDDPAYSGDLIDLRHVDGPRMTDSTVFRNFRMGGNIITGAVTADSLVRIGGTLKTVFEHGFMDAANRYIYGGSIADGAVNLLDVNDVWMDGNFVVAPLVIGGQTITIRNCIGERRASDMAAGFLTILDASIRTLRFMGNHVNDAEDTGIWLNFANGVFNAAIHANLFHKGQFHISFGGSGGCRAISHKANTHWCNESMPPIFLGDADFLDIHPNYIFTDTDLNVPALFSTAPSTGKNGIVDAMDGQGLRILSQSHFFRRALLSASTTAAASGNIPDGVAPNSPVNGDWWFVGADMYRRSGGVTYKFTGTAV